MNQELLNQINEAYRTGNTISLKVNGVLDTELVKDIHELYYNGHLHLPKYYQVFGYSKAKNLREAFKRLGLNTLSMKQTHEIYRSDIQSGKKKTNLERYGCTDVSQDPTVREKVRKTNLERYGVENPGQDPTVREKVKKTNLERYGSASPFGSPEIRMKIRETFIRNFGYDNPFQSPDIQDRIKQTNLKIYGSVSPLGSPEVRKKIVQTNLERYGSVSPFGSPEIITKSKMTCKANFGYENPLQSPEIIAKVKQTNLNRYGYISPLGSPEIWNKIKTTNLERYGVKIPTQSPIIQEKMKQTRKSNDWRIARMEYLVENEPDKVSVFVMSNFSKGNHAAILRRYGLYQENLSSPEIAIREILERHNIEYLFRHRPKFMDGKELDFFIPASNNPVTGKPVAIEVNGLYWHSSKFKDKYYHQDKHLRCRSEGIQLLSFTEDQILDRLDIIESMILHKLGLTPYRVYAKKCQIRELNTQQAKDFLEKNHLHGFSNASVYLGLEYKGKLVHVMSFGNNRFKKSDHPELIRSASLRFHSVAGGFQRLLKYYKRSHGVNLVESYVDFNISNGNSYELASEDLGDLPVRDNLTEPDLWFVYKGKRYRRQMFMKHNLHKIFEDFPRRSDKGYKEINSSEYLRDRGVLDYYGAGNLKYLI